MFALGQIENRNSFNNKKHLKGKCETKCSLIITRVRSRIIRLEKNQSKRCLLSAKLKTGTVLITKSTWNENVKRNVLSLLQELDLALSGWRKNQSKRKNTGGTGFLTSGAKSKWKNVIQEKKNFHKLKNLLHVTKRLVKTMMMKLNKASSLQTVVYQVHYESWGRKKFEKLFLREESGII